MNSLVPSVIVALVGSVSAFIFALVLRLTDKRNAYKNQLDTAVARVIGGLTAAVNAFGFAYAHRSGAAHAIHPGSANEELSAAVRVARMVASGSDGEPLEALYQLITTKDGTSEERTSSRSGAADLLLEWRRGEHDAKETAQLIRGCIPQPAEEQNNQPDPQPEIRKSQTYETQIYEANPPASK